MKRTGITLFLVTLLHTLHAQYPHFRVINTTHGLAQNTVSQVKQDSRGFVWVVTQEGLQRYDGFTFKTYRFDPNNPNGLLTNNILDMYVAPDDKIWMATRLGVSVLNPVTDSIFHLSPKKGKWKLST